MCLFIGFIIFCVPVFCFSKVFVVGEVEKNRLAASAGRLTGGEARRQSVQSAKT